MTRLDRLFVLLESGSTAATRKAAAAQLGEVQRLHPHELPFILSRVHKCVRSPSWETRVAAGLAVEAIVSKIPPWSLDSAEGWKQEDKKVKSSPTKSSSSSSQAGEDVVDGEEGSELVISVTDSQEDVEMEGEAPGVNGKADRREEVIDDKKQRLNFNTFDLDLLTSSPCNFLMASDTKVFEDGGSSSSSGAGGGREDPANQRALINQRLGLDVAEKMGIDTSDIVSNEDLVDSSHPCPGPEEEVQSQTTIQTENNSDPVVGTTSASCSKHLDLFNPNLEEQLSLSSREINLAKRRARKMRLRESQQKSMEVKDDHNGNKRLKREDSVMQGDLMESWSIYSVEEGQWPLSAWVDVLINDLFSPMWEVRHGAATALREVLKLHGNSGGREPSMTRAESDLSHAGWVEDLSLRLVSVLALDRFGDFVSDQVVAPVRETCSQCLGAVVALMSATEVYQLVQILIRFLQQKAWEVRHGALLGLKYIFVVRRDLIESLLPTVFPAIFECLSDKVDDVSAVAASCLIPVSDLLVETLPRETKNVVNVLWESLAALDDLSSACNSIMGLLAGLLAFPKARSTLWELDVLIPRLWPFLHHTSSSVRRSALLTLQKLTELDSSVAPMSVGPLQETLRHTYQRALVEHVPEVNALILKVWCDLLKSSKLENLLLAACPCFGTWLCLAMQPPRVPIDPFCLLPSKQEGFRRPKCVKLERQESKNHVAINSSGSGDNKTATTPTTPSTPMVDKTFMGGSGDGDPSVIAAVRLRLTKMLGNLAAYIVRPVPNGEGGGEEPIELFVRVLMVHLNSRSALQRTTTSLVVSAWPEEISSSEPTCTTNGEHSSSGDVSSAEEQVKPIKHKSHLGLCKRLNQCLQESVYFDEVAVGFTKLQSECRDFVATLKHYKVPLPQDIEAVSGNLLFSLQQIEVLGGEGIVETVQKHLRKPKVVDTLLERRKTIWSLWTLISTEFTALNITTLAAVSAAVVSTGPSSLPEKLNPVVKPLMDSIRREGNIFFQDNSAQHLCILMDAAIERPSCPNSKIIQNLVGYLCCDSSLLQLSQPEKGCVPEGILSLASLTGNDKKLTKQEEQAELEANKTNLVQTRGATLALAAVCRYFGINLPEKVPRLWEMTFGVLEAQFGEQASSQSTNAETLQSIVNALVVLEVISPSFSPLLYPTLSSQIPNVCDLLNHKEPAIRHMASRCLGSWASLITDNVMAVIAKDVLPRLEAGGNDVARQGALEAVWCVVDKLGLNLLPYIVLLVVPVLGRMSDLEESVRMLASLTFATLVRLMPLEGGVPDPPNLPLELCQQKGEQRAFLEQLLDPSKIPAYEITVPIQAELRPYQQAGVNWLGFLNKFKLHGILCDDMGLGKTLQSICILGSDHKEWEERYKNNNCPENKPCPSIVICPPTLTGHWVYEVEKFISSEYLHPLHYHGPPVERNKLKPRVKLHNLVVASYDIVRNDIDFFSSIRWNYCILDEGHIIKNGKTKISKAIKQLRSDHRLILSGTPIQNNVLELWSLFDFLMPGFLGTEKQFSQKFGRPILMARDPKGSPKDQEAGALAMEALHRQALPFLLRRLKEDVLQDLPPKITQDYYCELSSIQEQLYEDFARTKAHQSLRDTFTANDDPSKHSHIFQALQYLRKVCNHPKLVLTPQHPKFNHVMATLHQNKSTLDDINHSAKLPALKQLLLDCGIGVNENTNNATIENFSVVGQHRALIFCQLKVMLDILEHDLFKIHMPSVTYLRLDGGVPAGQRHSLVTRFNNDPSIDVLLLTTQVGGLGLNLTGADTVIFVEHDWNPMRDLQAMDRAHRIGQKKVVNVYRLITRGTLEEKIMGLQKFKLMTANTIISQDNASLETMATDQLLDLFVLEDAKELEKSGKKEDVGGIVGAYKNVLENLPELWEDKLYEEEYDLSHFIKNLGK